MSHELSAKAYCKLKGLTFDRFLGKGNFGEAYLASNDTVIKITKDAKEVLAACHIKGQSHENVASIYSIESIGNNHFVIEQEYVPHNSSADELYWEISGIADRIGLTIDELFEEFDEHIDYPMITPELKSAMEQLISSQQFFEDLGVVGGLDMDSDNFSYHDGKIKVFDPRYYGMSQEDCLKQISKQFPACFITRQPEHQL